MLAYLHLLLAQRRAPARMTCREPVEAAVLMPWKSVRPCHDPKSADCVQCLPPGQLIQVLPSGEHEKKPSPLVPLETRKRLSADEVVTVQRESNLERWNSWTPRKRSGYETID